MKDGFYAFSVEGNNCVKMVHNPGIVNSGITKFDTSSNRVVSGSVMRETFATLQGLCEAQKISTAELLKRGIPFHEVDDMVWDPRFPTQDQYGICFYVLKDEIVSRTYGMLYEYESWEKGQTLMKPSEKLRSILKKNSIWKNNKTDVKPLFRGQKLCKPLLGFFLSYLINHESINCIVLYNTSETSGGIPACYCYLKAGELNGLTLFNEKGDIITSEQCQDRLPESDLYYYVSPRILESTGGGGFTKKTRQTNRRRKSKQTNRRRKSRQTNRRRKTRQTNRRRKSRKSRNKRKISNPKR